MTLQPVSDAMRRELKAHGCQLVTWGTRNKRVHIQYRDSQGQQHRYNTAFSDPLDALRSLTDTLPKTLI